MDNKLFNYKNQRGALGEYSNEAMHKVFERSKESFPNDLFSSIREILIIGRILGVIPISGVFHKSPNRLSFRTKSFASIITFTITLILTLNLILALIHWARAPKSNALEIARSIHRTAQYCWGWLIYLSFLLGGNKFLELLQSWNIISSAIFYSVEDKTLKRDSICICGLILTSCILENAVLHLEYFKELDYMNGVGNKYDNVTSPQQSPLETYYWRSNSHWATILGFNEYVAILAFIQHKWMLYTWNYLDVLLAVFGRALYFKFKTLYHLSKQYLSGSLANGGIEFSNSRNKATWNQIVIDHKNLHNLLILVEEFFSSLIFGSYAVNIYYICIQLFIGISPDISVSSLVQAIYGSWGFLHMAIRIYIVTLCLARINQYAHQIGKVLGDCPIEIYTGEIARVDKRITSGPQIGLTGLGCFVVTKPFILSIVGVIFTFEIVLLQGTSSYRQ